MENEQSKFRQSILKRRLVLIPGFLILAVLAIVVVLWALWPREPVYQGRDLTAWLTDFDHEEMERRVLAAGAVRRSGVDAVPFLIERLRCDPNSVKRESRLLRWKRQSLEWLNKHTFIKVSSARPANPRRQALASLDALGHSATNALPALEKLLEENPPDPQVLYVVARIGPPGLPVLYRALTNSTSSEAKLLRLEARVCFDMLKSRSEALFPKVESGPGAYCFDRRICEFNSRVLQAAYRDYRSEHPEMELPRSTLDEPTPSVSP
jgi:hypothetical protein